MARCEQGEKKWGDKKLVDLDEGSRKLLLEHLKNCPRCRGDISFEEALFAYFKEGTDLPAVPSNLTEKIMARVMKLPRPDGASASDNFPPIAWLLPLLLMLGLAYASLNRAPVTIQPTLQPPSVATPLEFRLPPMAQLYNKNGQKWPSDLPLEPGRPYLKKETTGAPMILTSTRGDQIALGPEAALFSITPRGLDLQSGHAWARAAKRKSSEEPLTLIFPTGQVRVLGTIFKIQVLGRDQAEVGVTEGQVAVQNSRGDYCEDDALGVVAGYKRILDTNRVSSPIPFKESGPFDLKAESVSKTAH